MLRPCNRSAPPTLRTTGTTDTFKGWNRRERGRAISSVVGMLMWGSVGFRMVVRVWVSVGLAPTSFSTVTPIAYIKTYSFVETQHWNTDTSPTALTHWTWFRPKQLRKNKHFFDYMTAILLRDVAACGEVILLKMGYIKETTRTGNC